MLRRVKPVRGGQWCLALAKRDVAKEIGIWPIKSPSGVRMTNVRLKSQWVFNLKTLREELVQLRCPPGSRTPFQGIMRLSCGSVVMVRKASGSRSMGIMSVRNAPHRVAAYLGMRRIDLCPVYQMRLTKAIAWQNYKCTGIKRVFSLGSFAMGGSIQGTPCALCEYSKTARLNSFSSLQN